VREDQKKMKEKNDHERKEKEKNEKEKNEKKKNEGLIEKKGEFQEAIMNKQPLYLLLCKKAVLLTNTQKISSCRKFLLQEM